MVLEGLEVDFKVNDVDAELLPPELEVVFDVSLPLFEVFADVGLDDLDVVLDLAVEALEGLLQCEKRQLWWRELMREAHEP